jgi:ureidoacrylate peracid hydrolase
MQSEPDAQRRRLLTAGLAALPLAAMKTHAATSKQPASRRVLLDARPEPIEFDVAQTAVIVVDMQNDFGAKGGMFDRAGIDISGIQKAVAPTARVLAAARQAGMRVVYLKMGYRPDLSDLGAPDSVNRKRHMRLKVGEHVRAPDGSDSRILVRDTWNTAIVDELRPTGNDLVLWKTRFSGFYQTSLHEDLQRFGCRHLIVTGCTTSICVESTVRDAMFRDYLPVLLSDCMSEPIGADLVRSNHEASLLSTEVLLGWISDSERFVRASG